MPCRDRCRGAGLGSGGTTTPELPSGAPTVLDLAAAVAVLAVRRRRASRRPGERPNL